MLAMTTNLTESTNFTLSPRERELLTLLNKGAGFRDCSGVMGITVPTAKTLAARAYQKLGVENMQSALFEARQIGEIC